MLYVLFPLMSWTVHRVRPEDNRTRLCFPPFIVSPVSHQRIVQRTWPEDHSHRTWFLTADSQTLKSMAGQWATTEQVSPGCCLLL